MADKEGHGEGDTWPNSSKIITGMWANNSVAQMVQWIL